MDIEAAKTASGIITNRLHVMHCHDLSDLFWPTNDCFRGVDRNNIGAIISVEPFKADPQQPLEHWRLSPEKTKDISRHFTEVFYADKTWTAVREGIEAATGEAGEDPVQKARFQEVVNRRLTALSETLKYADDFLASEATQNKKLVVHSYCAKNFSPAVMLAIIADQFPFSHGDMIIDMLKKVNHETTVFKNAELAFVDAAMRRNGELVTAWHQAMRPFNDPEHQFKIEKALTLQRILQGIVEERTRHHTASLRDSSEKGLEANTTLLPQSDLLRAVKGKEPIPLIVPSLPGNPHDLPQPPGLIA